MPNLQFVVVVVLRCSLPELIGSLKLGNVWVLELMIFVPHCPMNQLKKTQTLPNLGLPISSVHSRASECHCGCFFRGPFQGCHRRAASSVPRLAFIQLRNVSICVGFEMFCMSGLVAKEKRRATEERRPPTHPAPTHARIPIGKAGNLPFIRSPS